MLVSDNYRYYVAPCILVSLFGGYYAHHAYSRGFLDGLRGSSGRISSISQTHFNSCEDLLEYSKQVPLYQKLSFEETTADVVLRGWEEEWIANGVYDLSKHGSLPNTKIDVVVTWVNGTDQDFRLMKEAYESISVLNDGSWFQNTNNRYRDWDELRYCIRSLSQYKDTEWFGKIHLVVTETKNPLDLEALPKVQIPSWLKQHNGQPHIQITAHRDLFTHPECLPTFNSKAVEAQFPNLLNTSSEHILSMNDDMFLGNISSTDTHNELFGSAISFFPDQWRQLLRPQGSELKQPGETSPAVYAAWLLTERFGKQWWKRPAHYPRSIDLNIMREAYQTFPQDAIRNSAQRFRHEGAQVSNWLLVYHYTVERHREAVLWSYIMMRMDKNGDGYLDFKERRAIKEEYDQAIKSIAQRGEPPMVPQINLQLKNAGLETHKAYSPIWTSVDGPFHLRGLKTEECSAEYGFDFCFGNDFLQKEKVRNPEFYSAVLLDRISHDFPACGNCLMHILLRTTSLGLNPLLPTSRNARQKAVKAIHKYRYNIGEQDGIFAMIANPSSVQSQLVNRIAGRYTPESGQTWPSYVCMNDDVTSDNETIIKMVYDNVHTFLETSYPAKSDLEY